jgi:hypothetical protein
LQWYDIESHNFTGKSRGLMLAEIVDILYHPAFEETLSVDERHMTLYAQQA